MDINKLFDIAIERLSSFNIYEELALAKNEFFELTGKPIPSDPFYDSRMSLFLEWFFIERFFLDSLTPLELLLNKTEDKYSTDFFYLANSHRSFFELMAPWKKRKVWIRDLLRGGEWEVDHYPPFPGIEPGQQFDARLIFYNNNVIFGKGFVFHPNDIWEELHSLLAQLTEDKKDSNTILSILCKIHLRSYRYSHLSSKRFYNIEDPLVKDIFNQM